MGTAISLVKEGCSGPLFENLTFIPPDQPSYALRPATSDRDCAAAVAATSATGTLTATNTDQLYTLILPGGDFPLVSLARLRRLS